jgi:uncharacterized protein (DUF1499 family)
LLEVGDDGNVELKSSSRVGESDFGVNKARVDYLTNSIKALGWNAAN